MKYSITALIIFSSLIIFGQTPSKKIKTDVEQVTVFLLGAQINRSAEVSLQKGKTEVIFEGVSPNMDPSTIKVKVADGIRILSISHELDFLNVPVLDKKIRVIKDSMDMLTDLVQANTDIQQAYNTEKNMLLKNQSIGGTQTGVNVDELNKARQFFYTNILRVNKALSKLKKEKKTLSATSGRLSKALNELNYSNNNKRYNIKIIVEANNAVTAGFDLNYLVERAGWAPTYDIIATDISSPIILKYKAKTFNNTGINWNKVKLFLSTADPYRSASKPELLPWYLDYTSYSSLKNKGKYLNTPSYNMMQARNVIKSADQKVDFKEVLVSEMSVDFDIKEPYTIPCNSKPYLINISENSLKAEYSHFAVPKLEKNAFLLARVAGWEDLNLVEGTANIYLDNEFVGKSEINTFNFDDTLDISLGRDQNVLIERTEKREFRSKSFIGTQRKESFVYEIRLKNQHKTPIQMEIQDQYPISKNSNIIVSVHDISNAKEDEETGLLKWEFELKPGEVKAYKLSYTVKYPKNKKVVIKQKYRAIPCPKF